ncbi:MAG: hypothetical protein HY235_17425 [Acidobacteria bacterium]|nr:hypothetical protein [Acidobacteriota bacterium]
MSYNKQPQRGHLTDLGPDGLGFIIPTDDPSTKLAFCLRHLKLNSFEESGLREGDWVEFQINEKRQIDSVTPISTR